MTTAITAELLDRLAFEMDPEADAAVAAWFAAKSPGAETHEVHREMFRAIHAAKVSSGGDEDVVPEVRAFLDAKVGLPAWHDDALVRRGQQLFEQWAPEIGLGLFVASLPAGYAGARGAKVLASTGELTHDPKRRIFETAQFLVHLMEEGSLEPGGKAYESARRVRLLHGAVRHLLKAHGWDASAHKGEPVNQEDLLGTLWTFSLVTLDVLKIAGVEVDEKDAEAYVHLWQVAGHLMGIEPGLLPMSMEEARASFDLIRDRQYSSSEDGHALARALEVTITALVPGHLVKHLVPAAIHHYAGERVATTLGIGQEGWLSRHVFALGRDVLKAEAVADEAGVVKWTTESLGVVLWRGVTAAEEGAPTTFEMPASLKSRVSGRTHSQT